MIHDIDIEDEGFVGKPAERNIEFYKNSIGLLCHTNHVCFADDIETLFQRFRGANCDAACFH